MTTLRLVNVGHTTKREMLVVVVETAIRQAAAVVRSAFFADCYRPKAVRTFVLQTALGFDGLTQRSVPEIWETAYAHVFVGSTSFRVPETGTQLSLTAEVHHNNFPADDPNGVIEEVNLVEVTVRTNFFGGREVSLSAELLNDAVNALLQGQAYPASVLAALRRLWTK